MSLGDVIAKWLASMETPIEHHPPEMDVTTDDKDMEDMDDMRDEGHSHYYQDLIADAPAYEWLLGSLRKGLYLMPSEVDRVHVIRQSILSAMPSTRKVSKKAPAESYHMTFVLDWNLEAFIHEQRYEENPGDAIEFALCVVGNSTQAQAMPCGRYLSQTWPSTGSSIMALVRAAISAPSVPQVCRCHLIDA